MRSFVTHNQALVTENPGGPASEASVERARNVLSLDSPDMVSAAGDQAAVYGQRSAPGGRLPSSEI
ncbi:hypothetical protein [Streptomyces flavofungini]|uniref:hypothetical protein n=1 Tax=Streptomyces flavofungini TaxID=68200 RepID=UPI0034DEB0E3